MSSLLFILLVCIIISMCMLIDFLGYTKCVSYTLICTSSFSSFVCFSCCSPIVSAHDFSAGQLPAQMSGDLTSHHFALVQCIPPSSFRLQWTHQLWLLIALHESIFFLFFSLLLQKVHESNGRLTLMHQQPCAITFLLSTEYRQLYINLYKGRTSLF